MTNEGYGIKLDTIVLLGALCVGGYVVYKAFKPITAAADTASGIVSAATDTGQRVVNPIIQVETGTADLISSLLGIIKTDIEDAHTGVKTVIEEGKKTTQDILNYYFNVTDAGTPFTQDVKNLFDKGQVSNTPAKPFSGMTMQDSISLANSPIIYQLSKTSSSATSSKLSTPTPPTTTNSALKSALKNPVAAKASESYAAALMKKIKK
jgi:hypothetical protein